jgi:prepilin-type N-terminal cleavage/methylation domain-containing protein
MRARRAGFTMVELLLVLVLGAFAMAAAVTTLVRQERAYGQLRAMAGTQEDTRTGVQFLSGELLELSATGGDLLLASRDSIRIRALRKFGIVCSVNKTGKRLVVAQEGLDPFAAGDSIVVYEDRDTLMAADDFWQREYVTAVSGSPACVTTLGLNVAGLLPGSQMVELTLQGSGLRFDSVFPGAPVRQYETVTYATGSVGGETLLTMRQDGGTAVPLLGPLTSTSGLVFRYFDGSGTELTSLPLSAADRAAVRRIQVALRAERWGDARSQMLRDSVITDIYVRGG